MASGVVGLAGVPPEAMVRLIQSFRLAQRIAVIYGYDPATDRGRIHVRRVFSAAWGFELPVQAFEDINFCNSPASWMPERWRCTTAQPGSPDPRQICDERHRPPRIALDSGPRRRDGSSTAASWLECKARKCTMLSGGAGRALDRNTSRMPSDHGMKAQAG